MAICNQVLTIDVGKLTIDSKGVLGDLMAIFALPKLGSRFSWCFGILTAPGILFT